MSFASPWLLLGLLLVPLLVLAYGLTERRRRRAAAAFAAPPTAVSVVPRRPGWRRHAPHALAGLALAGLIVALARPQVSVAVPAEQASIVLDDGPLRLDAGDRRRPVAAGRRARGRRGVPRRRCPRRCGSAAWSSTTARRRSRARRPTAPRCATRCATAMKPSGGTATGDALAASLAMLEAQRGAGAKRPPGAIVLLSDGKSTERPRPGRRRRGGAPRRRARSTRSRSARRTGTLPDGEPVPPDTASLRAIAERSGGAAFTAQDAGGLSAVYERLGSQVAMKEEPREITGAFAGGAIAAAPGRRRAVAALVPAADLRLGLRARGLTVAACAPSRSAAPASPPRSSPASLLTGSAVHGVSGDGHDARARRPRTPDRPVLVPAITPTRLGRVRRPATSGA